MERFRSFQALFKRQRQPGDLIFSAAFLVLALVLASQIGEQTKWVRGQKLAAQPAFWPAVSLGLMALFAALHFASSLASPKITGRWREVAFWGRSVEYALWFMAYVWAAPQLGYLPATMLFMAVLALRIGYRSARAILTAVGVGGIIVLVFKTFLQVKVPGGRLYEMLPDGARAIMLTYF